MAFFQSGRLRHLAAEALRLALHLHRVHFGHTDAEGELDGFFDLVLVGAQIDFEDVLVAAREDRRLLRDDRAQEHSRRDGVPSALDRLRLFSPARGTRQLGSRPRAGFTFAPPQSASHLRTASSDITTWWALTMSTTLRLLRRQHLRDLDVAAGASQFGARAHRSQATPGGRLSRASSTPWTVFVFTSERGEPFDDDERAARRVAAERRTQREALHRAREVLSRSCAGAGRGPRRRRPGARRGCRPGVPAEALLLANLERSSQRLRRGASCLRCLNACCPSGRRTPGGAPSGSARYRTLHPPHRLARNALPVVSKTTSFTSTPSARCECGRCHADRARARNRRRRSRLSHRCGRSTSRLRTVHRSAPMWPAMRVPL